MSLSGWDITKRLKLIIDSTKVDENLANFPVSIVLSSGTGITNFDASAVFSELTPVMISGTAVSGTYDSYTKLMLHMDVDQSNSQHTVTVNGNPQIVSSVGKFNGSMYFDGSGDYLSISDSSDWNFSNNPFTIDFWMRWDDTPGSTCLMGQSEGGGNNLKWALVWNVISASKMTFHFQNPAGTTYNVEWSWSPSANTWYHVAIVRDGNNWYLFINGAMIGGIQSQSATLPDVTANFYIGADGELYGYFKGYLDEIRISKGTARWTNNFIPPSDIYTTVSGIDSDTKLLLRFDGDQSDSSHSLTFNGNSQIYSSQGKFDGSYYFDGSGDYLTIPDSIDWYFGDDPFTIDCWIYPTSLTSAHIIAAQAVNVEDRWIFYTSGDVLSFHADNAFTITTGSYLNINAWQHVAVCRIDANDWRLYVNGIERGSSTTAHTMTNKAAVLEIGRQSIDPYYFTGNIDEFRISKGIARWVDDFDPPAGPYGSSWDNRKKIAVTTVVSGAETQLYTEIERWDSVNNQAWLWTKVPTVYSGSNTSLYLYYDSSHANNTTYIGDVGDTPAQNVWDNGFVAVYHLAQDPSGDRADSIKDSTVSGHSGTPAGAMTFDDLVDGKIGKSIQFDGSNDNINVGASNAFDFDGDFWISCIIKYVSGTSNWVVLKSVSNNDWNSCSTGDYVLAIGADFRPTFYIKDEDMAGANGTVLVEGEYYQIDIKRMNNAFYLYVNGNRDGLAGSDSNTVGNTNAFVMSYGESNLAPNYFDGVIDEVRVFDATASDARIKANYYSNWNNLITYFSSVLSVFFANPIPVNLSTVYGTTQQLRLTTTISGEEPSYVYDAKFYDASDDSQIGSTIYSVDSGQYASTTMQTPLGTDYDWYLWITSSGEEHVSDTYTFTNRFLCSGYSEINGTRASGVPVRLYRRTDGSLIGLDITSGVSGTFEIETSYNEPHYAVALHPTDSGTNALIYDYLTP